jgi:hypothetical protein
VKLVHDVLDKELVDQRHHPVGRVDGVVILVQGDGQPRVVAIEIGATVLATRLHPRLGRWARALAHRWGLRRGQPTRISWSKVKSVGIEVELDLDADKSPSLAWEHFLRKRFLSHLPGGK